MPKETTEASNKDNHKEAKGKEKTLDDEKTSDGHQSDETTTLDGNLWVWDDSMDEDDNTPSEKNVSAKKPEALESKEEEKEKHAKSPSIKSVTFSDTETEEAGEFLLVENNNKTKLVDITAAKKNRFGIRFSKIQTGGDKGIHPDDFLALFQIISEIDKDAVVLPHNNDIKLGQRISKMRTQGKDFKGMLDLQMTAWGNPKDNKTHLAFSFYIASDLMQPDLKTLQNNERYSQFMKEGDLRATPHCILETTSKAAGFFVGKDVKHTWRQDVLDRLDAHIREKLADKRTLNNHTNKSNDAIPESIPIFVLPTTTKLGDQEAMTLTVYVGSKDLKFLEQLLQDKPFSELELVPHAWKRSNPKVYESRIQIHNAICDASTAVKVIGTTEDSRAHLRACVANLKENPDEEEILFDMSTASHTTESGTIYFQCDTRHKQEVIEWVELSIAEYHSEEPDAPQPWLATQSSSKGTAKSDTPKPATTSIISVTESKYQKYIDDATYATRTSKQSNNRRAIPRAINTNIKSFAQALMKETTASPTASVKSNASTLSQTSGGTTKTAREIELEEEVRELKEDKATLTSDKKAMIAETAKKIQQLETKQAAEIELLKAEKAAKDKETDQKLETWQAQQAAKEEASNRRFEAMEDIIQQLTKELRQRKQSQREPTDDQDAHAIKRRDMRTTPDKKETTSERSRGKQHEKTTHGSSRSQSPIPKLWITSDAKTNSSFDTRIGTERGQGPDEDVPMSLEQSDATQSTGSAKKPC